MPVNGLRRNCAFFHKVLAGGNKRTFRWPDVVKTGSRNGVDRGSGSSSGHQRRYSCHDAPAVVVVSGYAPKNCVDQGGPRFGQNACKTPSFRLISIVAGIAELRGQCKRYEGVEFGKNGVSASSGSRVRWNPPRPVAGTENRSPRRRVVSLVHGRFGSNFRHVQMKSV